VRMVRTAMAGKGNVERGPRKIRTTRKNRSWRLHSLVGPVLTVNCFTARSASIWDPNPRT
jgi:hypothetical protein